MSFQHVVASGETLYSIAKSYDQSAKALADANGITDPSAVTVGRELKVPAPVEAPSKNHKNSVEGRRAVASRPPVESQKDLDWPLKGVLYARFGRKGKETHDGIDLAAPKGTPIRSAAAGTVMYAGEQRGYGLIAIVEHSNGLVTLYAHANDVRVKTGQKVRAGQVIATVGESGRTSGPHLHFEVRKDGVPVDPLGHLGPFPK